MAKITNEMIENAKKCLFITCDECNVCREQDVYSCLGLFATALSEERKRREKNPGIWDEAPDNCAFAQIYYRSSGKDKKVEYLRELPKSRERTIAEKWESKCYGENGIQILDAIESAIKEVLCNQKTE